MSMFFQVGVLAAIFFSFSLLIAHKTVKNSKKWYIWCGIFFVMFIAMVKHTISDIPVTDTLKFAAMITDIFLYFILWYYMLCYKFKVFKIITLFVIPIVCGYFVYLFLIKDGEMNITYMNYSLMVLFWYMVAQILLRKLIKAYGPDYMPSTPEKYDIPISNNPKGNQYSGRKYTMKDLDEVQFGPHPVDYEKEKEIRADIFGSHN